MGQVTRRSCPEIVEFLRRVMLKLNSPCNWSHDFTIDHGEDAGHAETVALEVSGERVRELVNAADLCFYEEDDDKAKEVCKDRKSVSYQVTNFGDCYIP